MHSRCHFGSGPLGVVLTLLTSPMPEKEKEKLAALVRQAVLLSLTKRDAPTPTAYHEDMAKSVFGKLVMSLLTPDNLDDDFTQEEMLSLMLLIADHAEKSPAIQARAAELLNRILANEKWKKEAIDSESSEKIFLATIPPQPQGEPSPSHTQDQDESTPKEKSDIQEESTPKEKELSMSDTQNEDPPPHPLRFERGAPIPEDPPHPLFLRFQRGVHGFKMRIRGLWSLFYGMSEMSSVMKVSFLVLTFTVLLAILCEDGDRLFALTAHCGCSFTCWLDTCSGIVAKCRWPTPTCIRKQLAQTVPLNNVRHTNIVASCGLNLTCWSDRCPLANLHSQSMSKFLSCWIHGRVQSPSGSLRKMLTSDFIRAFPKISPNSHFPRNQDFQVDMVERKDVHDVMMRLYGLSGASESSHFREFIAAQVHEMDKNHDTRVDSEEYEAFAKELYQWRVL